MRYLIISDIHSNLESLKAALQYKDYDAVVVLGDIVGYGANPNEVIDIIRDLNPRAIVRGNHDRVVAGLDEGELFVSHAYQACMWSRRNITESNRAYLAGLPQGPVQVDETFMICHGSPLDEDEYIIYDDDALPQFAALNVPACFFGHSHIPVIFALTEDGELLYDYPRHSQSYELDLSGKTRYLINPGSIGQPRDGNPQGSFAIFDIGKRMVEFFRYDYLLEITQQKILKAGLPPFLAHRLAAGR